MEGKIPTNVSTRNLILKSNDFTNPHKQNGNNTTVSSTDDYFVIRSTGYTSNTWGGMSWNMSISEVKAGEQFSILMPVYIDSSVPLDNGWSFVIKNHTLNSSAYSYDIPTNKKDQWFNVSITFKAYKDVVFDTYPFYVCLVKNGLVRIKPPMLVRGSLIPSDYQSAPEDNSLTSIDTVNLIKNTGSSFVMGYGITNTTWNETKKQSILDFSAPGVRRDISSEILPQGNTFFDFKPIKGTTYTQSIMIDTDATFNPNGQAMCTWFANGTHNDQKAYIRKVGDHSYQVWSTYTWNLEDTALRVFDWHNLHNILLFRTTGTYLAFYKPKLTAGNLPSDWSPSPEDIQAKITSVENRLITNLDSLNSMPGTLNAVKLTPGSITGDMITGGRLRSTNGWTVIDLTSGIITFNGSSSYIQHSKNNKIFEIQSLLINGSADVRENMIASFGIRKSDNSSKSGIKFSLYNPVGGKPTAEATINADSFSLLDSKNTPLLSVNGSNTYLGNWNIYGWGDIPIAFVNGGLTAKDVGLEGHTESLKKIIEKLCTKTGITWL